MSRIYLLIGRYDALKNQHIEGQLEMKEHGTERQKIMRSVMDVIERMQFG